MSFKIYNFAKRIKPRPLLPQTKNRNMKQGKIKYTAPNYTPTGIEGGVLMTITKSEI